MLIRQSTEITVPVRLIDATGTGVTGAVPADISNGVVGSITAVKSDGSTDSIALTDGVNWNEIDATKAPGLYHAVIPATATDVLGTFQVAVVPAAGTFLATIITAQVDAMPTEIDLLRKMGSNKTEIFTSGPNQYHLVVYEDDDTTELYRFELRDASGALTFTNPFSRTPA